MLSEVLNGYELHISQRILPTNYIKIATENATDIPRVKTHKIFIESWTRISLRVATGILPDFLSNISLDIFHAFAKKLIQGIF